MLLIDDVFSRPNGNMLQQEYVSAGPDSPATIDFQYNLSPEQIEKIKANSGFCIQDIGYKCQVYYIV